MLGSNSTRRRGLRLLKISRAGRSKTHWPGSISGQAVGVADAADLAEEDEAHLHFVAAGEAQRLQRDLHFDDIAVARSSSRR